MHFTRINTEVFLKSQLVPAKYRGEDTAHDGHGDQNVDDPDVLDDVDLAPVDVQSIQGDIRGVCQHHHSEQCHHVDAQPEHNIEFALKLDNFVIITIIISITTSPSMADGEEGVSVGRLSIISPKAEGEEE